MTFITNNLTNFASKYNGCMSTFKKNFKIKVQDENLLLFIKKFLIPINAVLSVDLIRKEGKIKQLKIYLNNSNYLRFFITIISKGNNFTGYSKKYLKYVKKSSHNLVRDIYILQTNKGFLTLEEALQKKTSGRLIMIISFFDYRITTFSRNKLLK